MKTKTKLLCLLVTSLTLGACSSENRYIDTNQLKELIDQRKNNSNQEASSVTDDTNQETSSTVSTETNSATGETSQETGSTVSTDTSSTDSSSTKSLSKNKLEIDPKQVFSEKGEAYQLPKDLAKYVNTYKGEIDDTAFQISIKEDGTYLQLDIRYGQIESASQSNYSYFDENNTYQTTLLNATVAGKPAGKIERIRLSRGIVVESFGSLYLIPLAYFETQDAYLDNNGQVNYTKTILASQLRKMITAHASTSTTNDSNTTTDKVSYPPKNNQELNNFYDNSSFDYQKKWQLSGSSLEQYSSIKDGNLSARSTWGMQAAPMTPTTDGISDIVAKGLKETFSPETISDTLAGQNAFYQFLPILPFSNIDPITARFLDLEKEAIYDKEGKKIQADLAITYRYERSSYATSYALYNGIVYPLEESDGKYILQFPTTLGA